MNRPLPRPTMALLAAAVLVAAPSPAAGQLEPGVQVVWSPDLADGSFGLGARLASGLGPSLPGLKLLGAFDYFFPDCEPGDCDFWELTGSVAYVLDVSGSNLHPYFGGGVTFQNLTRETGTGATLRDTDDFGFNVLAGAEARGGLAVRPFLELRYAMMDDLADILVLSLGVGF